MPTKNPRIHVVLEKPLYLRLKGLAKRNGLSLSLEARELIRQALLEGKSRQEKIFTGKNFSALIGKFRSGGYIHHDEVIADQAHG